MAAERGYRQCMLLLAHVLGALLMTLVWPVLNADLISLTGLFWGLPWRDLNKHLVLLEKAVGSRKDLWSPEVSSS